MCVFVCVCVACHYNKLADKITYCNMETKPSAQLYLFAFRMLACYILTTSV